MVDTVKKESDRHAQRLRKFIETASADTAFTLFVFVHLLKRKTQGYGQLLLAYSRNDTSLSQTRRDMLVDRPKSFAAPSHRWPPSEGEKPLSLIFGPPRVSGANQVLRDFRWARSVEKWPLIYYQGGQCAMLVSADLRSNSGRFQCAVGTGTAGARAREFAAERLLGRTTKRTFRAFWKARLGPPTPDEFRRYLH